MERHMSESAQNTPRTWDQPEGSSFEQWMESRVARFSTRKYDFDALKFQADFDPKYRRGQMRYIGTGGTGVAADSNTRSEEHTSELQSQSNLVCRLLLEKKKRKNRQMMWLKRQT